MNNTLNFISLIIVSFFYLSYFRVKSDNLTLELVQVLFRHGDRYPDKNERKLIESDTYDDIFKNFTKYGTLTKKGMLREYNFGKMLRERYNNFLSLSDSKEVYARSTSVERTKITLLLTLAGLYPSTAETSWSDDINWIPIATHYEQKKTDFLRINANLKRITKGKLFEEINKSPKVTEKIKNYRDFYQELQKKTKIKDFSLKQFFDLFTYVRCILAMDLALPDWCSQEDYKKLENLTSMHFESLGLTAAYRRAAAGPMIYQMLKNIKEHENDKKKMYLYAAHQTNIATFVQAHNFTGIPSIPEYGSAVIIEKHRGADGQTYLKMFYWTGVSGELIPINIESCDHVCLLVKYQEIVAPMLPNDEEKMCFSIKRFCNKTRAQ